MAEGGERSGYGTDVEVSLLLFSQPLGGPETD